MQYTINRVTQLDPPDAAWDRPQWTQAETLQVTLYPWQDSGHHPPTAARLLCDDRYLGVLFRVEDQYVRAVAQKFQDGVCSDSCVEFFIAPLPDSDAYFNFEVNCGGTMLLHRCPSSEEKNAGKGPYDVSPEDGATILMAHSMPKNVEPEIVEPTTWTVEYHIPFTLFQKYFDAAIPPTSGASWKGNFYKCGDKTSHPHWGTWAPVGGPKPSFHQPAFYQPVLFS